MRLPDTQPGNVALLSLNAMENSSAGTGVLTKVGEQKNYMQVSRWVIPLKNLNYSYMLQAAT